mgnify:CR=1 FL=1
MVASVSLRFIPRQQIWRIVAQLGFKSLDCCNVVALNRTIECGRLQCTNVRCSLPRLVITGDSL